MKYLNYLAFILIIQISNVSASFKLIKSFRPKLIQKLPAPLRNFHSSNPLKSNISDELEINILDEPSNPFLISFAVIISLYSCFEWIDTIKVYSKVQDSSNHPQSLVTLNVPPSRSKYHQISRKLMEKYNKWVYIDLSMEKYKNQQFIELCYDYELSEIATAIEALNSRNYPIKESE